MSTYNIHDYGEMVYSGRIEPFAQALHALVTADSVVLDLGAGPGIMTLLACQAGARKVYAVEPDGVIQVARETVAANGFADRVAFIQAFSTAVTLPEKVDVIVWDLRGVLPFYCGSLTAVFDARDRFLKPGGVLIPARDTVWVSVVNAPAAHRRLVGPWEDSFGLEYAAARRRAVNNWRRWQAAPDALLVTPKVWTTVDYGSQKNPNARGSVEWTIDDPCEAHGLCVWFDCEMAPGYVLSNAPGVEHSVYQQAFFPWPETRQLEAGDEITVEIRADLVGEDYIWSWDTELRGPGSARPIKARFQQSQFLSAPVSADWLRKSGASFVPAPNQEASIDRTILDLLFAGISLEEISRRVSDGFPERFPHWQKALTRVGDMSLRYSR
jgi:type I protein arginine methyltransferase